MKTFKFSLKSFWPEDWTLVICAMAPALMSSIGIYGLLITQVDRPERPEHLMIGGLSLMPSMVLYVVLLRMERSRKRRKQHLKERRRHLRNYDKATPFNNGDGLLSRFNGEVEVKQPSSEEIERMRLELANAVNERVEKGTLKSSPGKNVNISIDSFPESEGVEIEEGVRAISGRLMHLYKSLTRFAARSLPLNSAWMRHSSAAWHVPEILKKPLHSGPSTRNQYRILCAIWKK